MGINNPPHRMCAPNKNTKQTDRQIDTRKNIYIQHTRTYKRTDPKTTCTYIHKSKKINTHMYVGTKPQAHTHTCAQRTHNHMEPNPRPCRHTSAHPVQKISTPITQLTSTMSGIHKSRNQKTIWMPMQARGQDHHQTRGREAAVNP